VNIASAAQVTQRGILNGAVRIKVGVGAAGGCQERRGVGDHEVTPDADGDAYPVGQRLVAGDAGAVGGGGHRDPDSGQWDQCVFGGSVGW